jgi:hypothetical protein
LSDWEYRYDAELKGIVIEKYNGKNTLRVRIPDEIEGQPVVSIGRPVNSNAGAFSKSGVMSVYIPDTVVEIGPRAFDDSGLTSIILPPNLKEIWFQAFEGCVGLTEIVIPDSVEEISPSAFNYCTNLVSVTIGSNFKNDSWLNWSQMFSGCISLTNISVSVDNTKFADIDGVLFSKDKLTLVKFPAGRTGTYNIPDGTTVIGDGAMWGGAFSDNILTNIIIPSSITYIGKYAFYNSSLTNLIIPNGITSIEEATFFNCKLLVNVTIPDSVERIENSAFQGCVSLDEATRAHILSINPNAIFE